MRNGAKTDPRPSGHDLPAIRIAPPGPKSRRLAAELHRVESRNVTYVSDGWPVFLERGIGANLVDVDGNVYVDLGGAFAVAAAGHSNPRVVEALTDQAGRLLHGMGDVHPNELKLTLGRQLCELAPGEGPKRVIFTSSGAEAAEAAMKTAAVATGKPGVLCFSGGYHGLTYGALEVTDRAHFRGPFESQLGRFALRSPYPNCYRCPARGACPPCSMECFGLLEDTIDKRRDLELGAVIVEPIQGRGGDVAAPDAWLRALRRLCDRRGLLLIADEVYTGFGRTGRWFACEHAGIVPDLLCVGKGMSSGFPIAACIGQASVMDRWPPSSGEAIHTSTFIGNPTGCAAALASIEELKRERLVQRAAKLEGPLHEMLLALQNRCGKRIGDVRGRGLMWGLECVDGDRRPLPQLAAATLTAALRRGVIVLSGGVDGNVISLSPPLMIGQAQLEFAIAALTDALLEVI